MPLNAQRGLLAEVNCMFAVHGMTMPMSCCKQVHQTKSLAGLLRSSGQPRRLGCAQHGMLLPSSTSICEQVLQPKPVQA